MKSTKTYDNKGIAENQQPKDFKKIKQIYRGDPSITQQGFQQASLFNVNKIIEDTTKKRVKMERAVQLN